MEYGLIGAKLGHSHSPRIHRAFFDYDYVLRELTAEAKEYAARFDDGGFLSWLADQLAVRES